MPPGTQHPNIKKQQTFRLTKPLVEVLEARCRKQDMDKGEVVESLLRKALDMPPPPDQEEAVRLIKKRLLDRLGNIRIVAKALSILIGEDVPYSRLQRWVVDRSIPPHVLPYVSRLDSVAAMVAKRIDEKNELKANLAKLGLS